MRGVCRLLVALILLLAATGCGTRKRTPALGQTAGAAQLASQQSPITFTEMAARAGIVFQHHNGAHGKKYMPETVGSGVAFLDYDNDGWQDILIIDSTDWTSDHSRAMRHTPHLYHNNHNGTFTDVTHQSGLDSELYGMGVAVGDFDNDGYEDVYITAIGANHLFRNTLGDRNRKGPFFQDVTTQAGVEGVPYPGTELKWKWSTSAAWFDYDKDGKLDLLVCQYVQWSLTRDRWCGHYGVKGYCPPDIYEPTYCTLYHNEGSGKFRDVSDEMGIRSPRTLGKSFGVAIADFDGDGWPDIAITNDTWPNFLFINDQGKRFNERAVESGIALSENGKARAGMGIDCADWLNNGQFGLAIGNFAGESLSLYQNEGQLQFTDKAQTNEIGASSLLFLTFGLFFFDYDLDGRQDLFTANGHIDDIVATYSNYTFRQTPQLYHNLGDGRFQEVGAKSGLSDRLVARGAAFGDIDNDGYPEIAVVDNGGRFRLYHNDGATHNRWIRFRTEGTRSNRDGIGVIIRVTAGGSTQSQAVRSGVGFLSESGRQPTFGLGKSNRIVRVEVYWPSGIVDRGSDLEAGHQYVVTEGQGIRRDPRIPLSDRIEGDAIR